MKRLNIYVDASVIGGCEDPEFAQASLDLWRLFIKGTFVQVLSEHTLRELQGAPETVRARLLEIPEANQVVLLDTRRPMRWPAPIWPTGSWVQGAGRMPCMSPWRP